MISSNTRASRSQSRYSSLAQPLWSGPPGQGSRALMARWLEPAVQSRPSFEEAGLVRYGVLENMAPLGSLPKAKKPGPEPPPAVRRIILRPSGASDGRRVAGGHAARPPKPSPRPADKDLDDDDPDDGDGDGDSDGDDDEPEAKGGGGGRRRSKRVSLPASKPDDEPPRTQKRVEPEERALADKVVEAAVDEALKHYRYPTAWALRTLYDERCDDGDFVAMVEDVFRQTADGHTLDRFCRLVEGKKREGKRDDQGCYYFVPPTTSSRFTPHKAKAAPYASLLRGPEPEPEPQREPQREAEREADEAGSRRAAKRARTTGGAATGRAKARGESGSSTLSTLSSVMSLSSPEGSASPSLRGARASGARADAPKCQPITTCGKTRSRRNTSESNSPTVTTRPPRQRPADHAASMPGRLAASELSPVLPAKRGAPAAAGGGEGGGKGGGEGDDASWDRRRSARKLTAAAAESAVRTGQQAPAASPPRASRRTRQRLAAAAVSASPRATRSASKRPVADVDADRNPSPAAFSWQGDGSPPAGSRPATPRPPKKQRTGLRVKVSPVKKKGGTAAGVPRSMGEANAKASSGVPRDPTSDNDEYCSACGNAGDVVCCDGCPRSFHFECVDMVQSDDLPDEWYCNECLIRRFPSRVPVHKGIFAGPLNNLEKSIPRAFSLPKRVQNRFDGVRAGADGDYEDAVAVKTVKKRNGYDELSDFFKQREDGQPVLCHACQRPATKIRAIIPCSACPLYWHIDCLDPPLAVPPVLKTWRCPAHVDDVLAEAPGLAPAHRFRRLKGSQAIAPAISRGLRNNGHIDIDWSEELIEPDHSGWPDPLSFGRNYKLPAKGVVLDFIEQLRRKGAGYGARRHEPKRVPYPSPPAQRDASSPLPGSALERDIDEMQASLTLIGLRQSRSEPIDRVMSALVSAADDSVLALVAKSNADNVAVGRLTRDDRQGLRALLAQVDAMGARIRQVLGEDKPAPERPPVSADARTPVSEPPGANESGKLEPMAPVAEPTPRGPWTSTRPSVSSPRARRRCDLPNAARPRRRPST